MFARYFLVLLLTLGCRPQPAQNVVQTGTKTGEPTSEVITIESAALGLYASATVILPGSYNAAESREKRFPVVYLLHGHGGDFKNWLNRVPKLLQLADQHEIIIVCPDGGKDSWYFDSPMDPAAKYETHIVREWVETIDGDFRTQAAREGRAITGLSMGGHGALFLALRHPELFGAAGSMSGGVDLRPFAGKWGLDERLGPQSRYPDNWLKYSVVGQLDKLQSEPRPELLIDCGAEDFFYEVNLDLHDRLDKMKIPHTFISRPGKHDWPYWRNAVEYQLLFFTHYFSDSKSKE